MRLPRFLFALGLSVSLLSLPACVRTQHEVTHKFEPIEINLNVRLQIDKDLDSVFDDIDSASTTVKN